MFDDTYEHGARSDTDGERVVRFLVIEWPLRAPVTLSGDGILKAVSKSPFVKNARGQHGAREEEFTAASNLVVGSTWHQTQQAT